MLHEDDIEIIDDDLAREKNDCLQALAKRNRNYVGAEAPKSRAWLC